MATITRHIGDMPEDRRGMIKYCIFRDPERSEDTEYILVIEPPGGTKQHSDIALDAMKQSGITERDAQLAAFVGAGNIMVKNDRCFVDFNSTSSLSAFGFDRPKDEQEQHDAIAAIVEYGRTQGWCN